MLDVPADAALGGDRDDVARAEGGVGVRDEVALVGLEVLCRGAGGVSGFSGGRWGTGREGGGGCGGGRTDFFEELVVGLFGGADFDGAGHFAGGDDDAAEDFGGGAGHGGWGAGSGWKASKG